MMTLTTDLTSFNARMAALVSGVRPTMAAAVKSVADETMADSRENWCPVALDGGALQDSGVVDEPVIEPSGVSCTMRYGGSGVNARGTAVAKYAIAVHEHLGMEGNAGSPYDPPSWAGKGDLNWTKSGTGSKYLERPVMEHAKDLPIVTATYMMTFTGPVAGR